MAADRKTAPRRVGLLALAALVTLLAVGCGSESGGDDGGAGDGGGDSTEARPGPATEVTITFRPEGLDGESVEATLTCEPAGGTHPSPEKACTALAADPAALEPVAPDTACTMIFGGPEQATVVGVVNGEQVDAAFERSNGCELDRWDRMAAVLQIGD
ncbi:MAG TPA: SSI family serine proteinase inhibitor [Gaiellaceae bacterium]|nr:SSI family serine proteinase inhibitor [Gaiellaceae bacterium]